jgi:hypothetical protein
MSMAMDQDKTDIRWEAATVVDGWYEAMNESDPEPTSQPLSMPSTST